MPDKKHFPLLQSFRALGCLMVMYDHLGFMRWLPANKIGSLGVMIFFTISGFLMAYLHSPTTSTGYSRRFLAQRLFRIYPAFAFAVLVLFLVHSIPSGIETPPNTINPKLYTLRVFVDNAIISHQLLLKHDTWWHFWTIRLEIFCYIAFAFYAGLLNWPQLKPIQKILLSCAIWGFLLYRPGLHNHTFAIFAGGVVAGYIYNAFAHNIEKWQGWNILCWLFAILVPIAVYIGFFNTAHNYWWNQTPMLSPLITIAILSATLANPAKFRIPTNRYIMFLADISYSLYLIHPFVFMLIHRFLFELPLIAKLILALTISITAATLMRRFIEKPFIRLGKRLSTTN